MVDFRRLGLGEKIAGVGAVLLLLDTFLSWYSTNVPDSVARFAASRGLDTSVSVNAWEAYDWVDLLMLVTIIVVLGWIVMKGMGKPVPLPVAGSVIATVLSAIALVVVFLNVVVNQPGPNNDFVNNEIGAYFGLVLLIAMVYGGYTAMKTEGASFGQVSAAVQSRTPPN